tara:strand:+ start:16 stop:249 length:234 start_codon:yes stop_codon:yes gene_type:complete
MIKLQLNSYQQQRIQQDLKRRKQLHLHIGYLVQQFQNQIPFDQFCECIKDAQADIAQNFLGHAEITLHNLTVKMRAL